jgi:hypothetical protein
MAVNELGRSAGVDILVWASEWDIGVNIATASINPIAMDLPCKRVIRSDLSIVACIGDPRA